MLIATLIFALPVNFFSASGGVTSLNTKAASNSADASNYMSLSSFQRGDTISIDVVNTDIRDVLSIIAMNMGTNIIYLDDATNISLRAKYMTPKQALQVVLTKQGLSFIQNGNDIIVGKSTELENSLFEKLVLTKVTLRYLDASNIATEIDKLGLPLKFIETAGNSKVLIIQGTVSNISKAKNIINYLDVKGNGGSEISLVKMRLSYVTSDKIVTMAQQIDLTAKIITIDTNKYILWVKGSASEVSAVADLIKKVDLAENRAKVGTIAVIKLQYVTAAKVAEIISQIGLDVNVIDSGTDTSSLWVVGSTNAIAEVKKIVKQIDVIDNYSYTSGSLISINLHYITAERVNELVTALGSKAKLIVADFNPKTIWASGDASSLEEIRQIINTLDVPQNNNDIIAFDYPLVNITAEEATARLDLFQFKNVTTVMAKGALAKDIIVICPGSMKQRIKDALESVDVAPQKIKVPVDYSDSATGNVKLAARRDLLVSLTGISSSEFTISSDISRGDTPYFVLYLNETPDNIQKVVDMVKTIDSPLS